MSGHVQIVLREDVKHLGQAGDLVRVRAGYARNYLLPRAMAVVATRGSIEQVENQRKAAVARAAKMKKGAEALASTLSELSLEIARSVGEGDRLFGSVTTRDVAEALAAKGYEVDRKKIVLDEPIKALGEYELAAKLGQDVTATIKLTVKAEA